MSGKPIEIAAYDPAWPAAFEVEAERIQAALGPLAVRIDHHGSTAVPRLAAKPVIDIQISVEQLHPLDPYREALESLGYRHFPHQDDAVCPFFYQPAEWPHTHHVHVVEAGGAEEQRTLIFRDFLRMYPEVAQEYEALKRSLAPRFDTDTFEGRQAYADAKSEFIESILPYILNET